MKASNQISQISFSTSTSMWGNHYGGADAFYGHVHMSIHLFPMLIQMFCAMDHILLIQASVNTSYLGFQETIMPHVLLLWLIVKQPSSSYKDNTIVDDTRINT